MARLEEIASSLPGLHRERALIEKAAIERRITTWMDCQDDRISVRDATARHSSMRLDMDLASLTGEIRALEAEAELFKYLIDHL